MHTNSKRVLKKARSVQPFNWMLTRGLQNLSRQLPLPLDWLAKYLPPVGEVRTELPNDRVMRMWSEADMRDDQIARRVFWKGWTGFEPDTATIFYHLASQSDCTIDVGAHVGFYSLLAAHANPNGHVYAFEPLPQALERLRQNIDLNRLANVHIEPLALADHRGEVDFFHVKPRYGFPSSSSLSEKFMRSSQPDNVLARTSVRTLRLDDYAHDKDLTRIDLMKIDTETTEPSVLRGAGEVLRRDQPDIICEVIHGEVATALEPIMAPLGYRFYALMKDGPTRLEHITKLQWPLASNFLFTSRLDEGAVQRLFRSS